jgi:hypothetical protein
MGESQPPDLSRLRASDADRDQVAVELREALAEGRLTPAEHAERLDAVYAAKTYADLAPIVDDLPVPQSGRPVPAVNDHLSANPVRVADAAAAPSPDTHKLVAIFSGTKRSGHWLVPINTEATAIFGGVELDLREAVLSQREVQINITALFGGVQIKVPPGVRVIHSVSGIFGGTSVPSDDTADVNAPVVRITGVAVFGGVEVTRPKGMARRVREFRDRLRELRSG